MLVIHLYSSKQLQTAFSKGDSANGMQQEESTQETEARVDSSAILVAELKHMGFEDVEVSAAVLKFANLSPEEAIPAAIASLTKQETPLARVVICRPCSSFQYSV